MHSEPVYQYKSWFHVAAAIAAAERTIKYIAHLYTARLVRDNHPIMINQ